MPLCTTIDGFKPCFTMDNLAFQNVTNLNYSHFSLDTREGHLRLKLTNLTLNLTFDYVINSVPDFLEDVGKGNVVTPPFDLSAQLKVVAKDSHP